MGKMRPRSCMQKQNEEGEESHAKAWGIQNSSLSHKCAHDKVNKSKDSHPPPWQNAPSSSSHVGKVSKYKTHPAPIAKCAQPKVDSKKNF